MAPVFEPSRAFYCLDQALLMPKMVNIMSFELDSYVLRELHLGSTYTGQGKLTKEPNATQEILQIPTGAKNGQFG